MRIKRQVWWVSTIVKGSPYETNFSIFSQTFPGHRFWLGRTIWVNGLRINSIFTFEPRSNSIDFYSFHISRLAGRPVVLGQPRLQIRVVNGIWDANWTDAFKPMLHWCELLNGIQYLKKSFCISCFQIKSFVFSPEKISTSTVSKQCENLCGFSRMAELSSKFARAAKIDS